MLEKILKKINTIFGYIGGVFVTIGALVMLYDVICRYFFNSPSPYAQFIVSFLILGAVFFGAGYSFQAGGQVHIEIIVDKLPPLARKICYTIGYLFALTFVGTLARETWKFTVKAFQFNWMTIGNVRMPSGILYAIMVIGCVFLFLSVVLALVKLWTKKSDSVEDEK